MMATPRDYTFYCEATGEELHRRTAAPDGMAKNLARRTKGDVSYWPTGDILTEPEVVLYLDEEYSPSSSL